MGPDRDRTRDPYYHDDNLHSISLKMVIEQSPSYIRSVADLGDQSPTSRRRSPMGLNAKHADRCSGCKSVAEVAPRASHVEISGVRETNPMGLRSCFYIIGVSELDRAPVSARWRSKLTK